MRRPEKQDINHCEVARLTRGNLEQWPSLTLEPFYIIGVIKVIPYMDHLVKLINRLGNTNGDVPSRQQILRFIS